ncbi:DUF2243 domain-containing protein [Rhizobium sp. 0TCS1.26]|uniref:DUF2243 domain-containing protein n=1 Tax=Rhizobium sp. 0TCS1.26 TaxID=3142623 RepID=UPI003D2A003B
MQTTRSTDRSGTGRSLASAGLASAGLALGFGLGGFFDGILLHQVLQWHHLLSALEDARGDIRLLILTDGLFHLLMFAVTAIGLLLLWRARRRFADEGGDRQLLAHALLGFGGWHIIDALLSHWILGIHRIRMDSSVPLAWDLGWLLVFGLVPALFGWQLRRGPPRRGMRGGHRGTVMLVILTLAAAPIAGLPASPASGAATMIVFRPGTTPAQASAGLSMLGGQLVWSNSGDTVWAVRLPDDADASDFYRHGALLVSNGMLAAGCLNWFRADTESTPAGARSF